MINKTLFIAAAALFAVLNPSAEAVDLTNAAQKNPKQSVNIDNLSALSQVSLLIPLLQVWAIAKLFLSFF